MSASVENGGNTHEKSAPFSPVAIAMPQDDSCVGADKTGKKEARLTKYTKGLNYLTIAKYLFVLLTLVGVIVLAIQVSKDQDVIQKLNHQAVPAYQSHDEHLDGHIGDRMSYLEGFSGMVDDDDTVTPAARAVLVSGDQSTVTSIVSTTVAATVMTTVASSVDEPFSTSSCTSETEALSSTTTLVPVGSSTTAADNSTMSETVTTLHTKMTTTVFTNTTATSALSAVSSATPAGSSVVSADPISVGAVGSSLSSLSVMEASIMSDTSTEVFTVVPFMSTTMGPETTLVMTSATVPTSTESCLEYGDMAGPCQRPYGTPNAPPDSVTLSIAEPTTITSSTVSLVTVASVSASTIVSSTVSLMTVASVASSSIGSTTLNTGAVSGTESTTITSSSATDLSVCAPPTTIYVTLSTVTPTTDGSISVESVNVSPTVESIATGPSTLTSTSTSVVTTITALVPAATETVVNSNNVTTLTGITTSHMITATGFTLTLTAHNGTYSPTTGPAPVATLPADSGADRAAGGNPMGATGNGGTTGNGMYCVVMLVTLLALLI